MKQTILYISFFFIAVSAIAQNSSRYYKSHNEENGIFSVTTNDGKYLFQFYSEDIVETTFIPNGEDFKSESHAVVLQPNDVKTTYNYVGNVISFSTEDLSVNVTTEPFQISYNYQGKKVISEKRGYFKSKHEPMEMVAGNIIADSIEKIEFNLLKDEVLYGGGARALGMNRRGHRLPLYNRAHYGYETDSKLMNYTMPIVLSSKQYMIHFDNAPIGYLDLDSKGDNTLTYETISGRKNYQIIVGETWYDVMDNYTNLTGKQPLLPRWALGNFSSRFGYHSQEEIENTIEKFKEENIPVDAIILDLYWFGKDIKGTMGNLTFDRNSFPNPKTMIKDLQSKNVETILITEPFILTTSNRWDEAVKEGILAKDSIGNPATYDFYFGNTGIVDIYSEKGNQWFKNIYKDLANMGVNGFWGDLGEPEVLPSWVNFSKGTADEIHNIYGHDWAKLVYEASLEANPEQRPFILMRAGYSGSQRYGMVPWSGDVNRTWGGFQSQPEIALQMGMQGLAYMHSDLGGFAGANLDDELYVRWLQYGVFNPIFRPHAQEDVPSEPIFRSEKAKRLAKQAIELRYRLLPYNYNLVYENNRFGKPLMRPLFFEEADNLELFNYSKTYLWGNDILVSPVLESDNTEQEVYFPKTSNWFDFYTDEKIEGGQFKTVELKENSIPTFVRGGALIPMAKPIKNTSEYDVNNIELHYYLDKNVSESQRKFYNDDGKTTDNFENKNYQILKFSSTYKGRNLTIDFEVDNHSKALANPKKIDLVIHNIQSEPKKIRLNKSRIEGNYNPEKRTLKIPVDWDGVYQYQLKIKLKK